MKSKMTAKEAQKWLENVSTWWASLDKDLKEFKKLLDKHAHDETLTQEVVDDIVRLLKEVTQPRTCPPRPPN